MSGKKKIESTTPDEPQALAENPAPEEIPAPGDKKPPRPRRVAPQEN